MQQQAKLTKIELAHIPQPTPADLHRLKLQKQRQSRREAQDQLNRQHMGAYWRYLHGLKSITGSLPLLPPPAVITSEDMTSIPTQHLMTVSAGQQSDTYDLAMLTLPGEIEKYIATSKAIHHHDPHAMFLHPLAILTLTQAQIIRNQLWQGRIIVYPKPTLSIYAVEIKHYQAAS